MSAAGVVTNEFAIARKVMLRDPQSAFFTIGLPLLYLVIFASFFGDEVAHVAGQPGKMDVATIMTASVIVIGVVSAAFQNLAVNLVQDREYGVLKRLRSAPVRPSAFLAGQVLNALVSALVLSVLVTVLGIVAYGVPFPGQRTLAATVTALVGAMALAGVALPFTRLVKKASAAVPMITALTLTLFFISGNFFPGSATPSAIRFIANIFPVHHFFIAELTAFNPNTTGWGFARGELGVLVLWGIGGFALGARLFRWSPSAEE